MAHIREDLEQRPLRSRMVTGLMHGARDLLGSASWFAPKSRLLLECVRLQAQAAYGCALLVAAALGETVEIALDQVVVPVVRDDHAKLGSVVEWTDAWCAAVVAREQPVISGMRAVPDERFRQTRVQIDEYQYALKDALVAVVTDDRERCLAAVARGREQWNQRSVAKKSAADIDAGLFDMIEVLAGGQAGPFNDALYLALSAHAKHWSKGDDNLAARGWVALRHLALVCVAHDRGIAIEIESPYLPRALIERDFSPEPSLAKPPKPVAGPDELTRDLAILAGETFARLRLEPQGYRRVPVEHIPLAGFDLVYRHDGDVVLIDTLAADEELDAVHAANGGLVEAGTRPYVELMIANMRSKSPEVARTIEVALSSGKLRYFEVHQPIDDAGELGDIAVRQFAL